MKSIFHFNIIILIFLFLKPALSFAQPTCAAENSGSVRWFFYENAAGITIEDLEKHPFYPQAPEGYEDLLSLEIPSNYNNFYGSLIRGYLVPPVTGNYDFNATGDDQVHFYLSTNNNPANKALICDVPFSTNEMGHDDFAEQTSTNIPLVAGQYYYFEFQHKEDNYSNHGTVFWKIPGVSTTWQVIHGSYLYDYICESTCLPEGTPCNDGNPNTTNDIEDGFCICAGKPITNNPCVGDRDHLTALFYDDIGGETVEDMLNAPNYPHAPDWAEILPRFTRSRGSSEGYLGTRIQGYIYAPVTGTYSFNVVGDSNPEFYLSTSDNPNNLPSNSTAEVPEWTDEYEHNKFPEQTSSNIILQAGQYYYFEFLHKAFCCGSNFSLYWKTPFISNPDWTLMTGTYLYSYNCAANCVAGTDCSDGDEYTHNDQLDANCNCIGTPCANGPCDNGFGYAPVDACSPTNQHSSTAASSWYSCNTMPSPNPSLGASHWIRYDFDQLYNFQNIHIWNYNVAGNTGRGFENVRIDYSTNGTNWTQVWSGTWAQASGQNSYSGFDISGLNQFTAQHILITGLDNFENSNCMGFSEAAFTVEGSTLPLELVRFEAEGRKKDIQVYWEVRQEEDLSGYTLERSDDKQFFKPIAWMHAEGKAMNWYEHLDKEVELNQWYYYRLKMLHLDGKVAYSDIKAARLKARGTLDVYPNPTNGSSKMIINAPNSDRLWVEIMHSNGQQIRAFALDVDAGVYEQVLDLGDLPAGMYWVKVSGGAMNEAIRVSIVE